MQSRYLSPEDVKRLESYEFAPKVLVEGYLSGRHQSRAQGSSTEFHDHRPYCYGDSLGSVDWKVFARTERYYVRLFEQETNADCYLFVDSSGSMGFGETVSKLDYASFFAASLAYLITKGGDRVSLQLFDDQVRHFLPPGSTTKHMQQLLNLLENNKPGSHTSISEALTRAVPLIRKRGTLVVLSDFLDDPASIFTALNPYVHRGFEIHLYQILDPQELELPEIGLTAFRDMETGARLVTHTRGVREAYTHAMREHIDKLRTLARRRQINYTVARTDTHFFTLLDAFST